MAKMEDAHSALKVVAGDAELGVVRVEDVAKVAEVGDGEEGGIEAGGHGSFSLFFF